jgi:hypothetical protein
MENDTVRTTGDNTLVDMWIDGKLRAIAVSRRAIEAFLRLPLDRAAALTDDDRNEFVRTHLTLILQAAAQRVRDSDPGASTVTIDAGQLRHGTSPADERRSGGDRRKGDRRKVNLGPPPSGERRRR